MQFVSHLGGNRSERWRKKKRGNFKALSFLNQFSEIEDKKEERDRDLDRIHLKYVTCCKKKRKGKEGGHRRANHRKGDRE